MITVRRICYSKPIIKNIKPVLPTRQVITRTPDVNTVSYYVGKSIILFTMFYCTLNWAHYRRLRKDNEDKDKK